MICSIILAAVLNLAGSETNPEDWKVDDLQIRGMTIQVAAKNQTLELAPLEVRSASAEGELSVVEPTWRNGFHLPKIAWTYAALTPASVRVQTKATPAVQLKEGQDFVVNNGWATVGATAASRIKAGTALQFEFSYTASRIDLIELRPDGTLAVKQGVEELNVPLVPDPSPGCQPVFGVYLPHNTRSLSRKNVNTITHTGPLIPSIENASRVRDIMAQTEKGEPATIVFLGDSITAQQDVKGGSFVDRFTDYLRRRLPSHRVMVTSPRKVVAPRGNQVVVVKAGVGGNNSTQGLARFESDVALHRPQIVVVMFGANDENRRANGGTAVSIAQYEENIAAIIRKARQAGTETVILSPAMKNLDWVATSGLMDQFATAAGRAARGQSACFVDVHDAWKRIPTTGSNYMVYLNSSINHPNHLGHDLFFEGLRIAVE